MEQTKEQKLGTMPLPRLMASLAIPSVIAQLINVLYNIIDRMYIGHIPKVGPIALTGVGLTFPIIMLISAFSAFIGAGGAPLASIALGKGDKERAEKILGNGVSVLLIFSISLTIIFMIFKRPLLFLFGASDQTITYAVNYITIYLMGTIFVQFALGLNMFISSQGQARTAMLSVLIGAVINIILDPIFIFVLNMNVQGAALATIISQAVSAVWVVKFLLSEKSAIRIRRKNLAIDFSILKNIMALGISPFIMQATESAINIVLNRGLSIYGGDLYVGSMTILQSVMQLAVVPIQGFTQGVQPIISYNFGAGQPERVRKALRLSLRTALICGICFFILTTLCCRNIVALFIDRSYSAFDIAVNGIPYFGIGFIFFAINMIGIGYYPSIERGQRATIITLLRGVVFMLIGFFVLPPILGVPGIWLAVPSAELLTTLYIIGIYFKDRFIVRRR